MEPEGSLPQLPFSITCPYPEPDKSSPCPTSHFVKVHLNIILLLGDFILKFLVMQFLRVSCYFSLRARYSRQHSSVLRPLQSVCVRLLMQETTFHIHTKCQGGLMYIYVCVLTTPDLQFYKPYTVLYLSR